jgi:Flagellar hook capping protein
MTDAITSAASTSTSKAQASGKSLAQNFDTFLTMLTTQLKHQDPLSPMDSTQFTNQLVQFAGVEQQINANSNLEKLISATSLNTRSQSVNYIGHVIEADTDMVPLQGAKDTESSSIQLGSGSATFKYVLDSAASTTQLKIKDADGNVVRTLVGNTSRGSHEITWDGKNSAGETMADGTYTVEPVATTTSGATVGVKTYTTARESVAAFSYTLLEDAASCSIVIKDTSGTIVRTLPASGLTGRHEMTWDGKDSNGKIMPDGAYVVSVAALGSTGNNLESAITVYGRVTDVSADDSDTLLAMGRVVASISRVLTVRDTATVLTPGTVN